MPTLIEQFEQARAAAPRSPIIELAATRCFFDQSWDGILAAEGAIRHRFGSATEELSNRFGHPTWTLPTDRDWFDRWYPESLDASAWDFGDRVVCLAVDHSDKEAPVTMCLRCLTSEELIELSAE